MNRWLSSLVVLGLMSSSGCEPPPKAERASGSSSLAKAGDAKVEFVPKAPPKPKPTPSVVAAPPPPPPPPPPPKRLTFDELTLPSGRKIAADMLFLNSRSLVSKFPTVHNTYFVDGDAKERLTAAVRWTAGKFEGAGIIYDPDKGRPIFVAQFKNNLREGAFWGWGEDGAPLYWAEFRNGQHDGLVCLIKNREPVFIQEWKINNLKAQYMVELIDNKEFRVREIKPSDAAIDKVAQDYAAKLKLAEERYLETEKARRRDFVAYLQKKEHFEEYMRLTRGVAPTSPAKKEELRRYEEFQHREIRLYNAWQYGFWQTPL